MAKAVHVNRDDLQSLINQGFTVSKIAERLGFGHSTIEKFLKIYGLKTHAGLKGLSYSTENAYNLNPKCCKNCDRSIPYKKRDNLFCSSNCSASFNNDRRNDDTEILICLNCGLKKPSTGKRFCSIKCSQMYVYGQYIQDWIAGVVNGMSETATKPSNYVRRYILERDKFKCVLCGWGEINVHSGKTPLHLDHIDGDYRNNRPENLRMLCPNCHSLTATYGSLNKGNGRPWHVIKRN